MKALMRRNVVSCGEVVMSSTGMLRVLQMRGRDSVTASVTPA
jgi:hypothetical protein